MSSCTAEPVIASIARRPFLISDRRSNENMLFRRGLGVRRHRAVLAISAKNQRGWTARVAPVLSCRSDALVVVAEGPVQGAPSPTGRARSAIAARDGSAACVTSAVLRATRRRPATEERGAFWTDKAQTAHEPAPARLQQHSVCINHPQADEVVLACAQGRSWDA